MSYKSFILSVLMAAALLLLSVRVHERNIAASSAVPEASSTAPKASSIGPSDLRLDDFTSYNLPCLGSRLIDGESGANAAHSSACGTVYSSAHRGFAPISTLSRLISSSCGRGFRQTRGSLYLYGSLRL